MTNRPRRAARPLPSLPSLLPQLLPLLLLLLVTAPSRATKPRASSSPPAANQPLAPYPPDALLDALLSLAQVPSPDPDAVSRQQQQAQLEHSRQQKLPRDDDFVFATGTCRERLPLAKSTRAWRRGIRALMLTDQEQLEALGRLNAEGVPHNESYAFFPDDRTVALGGVAHGTKQGDTRAAVAPFAAHRHFGETYKWMLYGDDDTLFFLEPVKRLLSAFDPELPLALSDNLWYFGQQPNAHAPRCLPCHMTNETLPSLKALAATPGVREHIRKYLQMRSSNVTEKDVDEVVREGKEVPGRLFVPRPACPICTPAAACNRDTNPTVPCNPSVAHGGAGMIFSVGLMRSLPYRDALTCIRSFRAATGGDALLANCLWRHGVAFTDPGPLVRHAYDPHYHVFGGKAGQGYMWDPIGMVTHGRCNSRCRWMLRNTLTLHLKGRHFRNWRVGSVLMWGVAHAVQAAEAFLDLMTHDGDVSWKQLPYGYDVDDTAGFAPYMALASPLTPSSSGAAEGGANK